MSRALRATGRPIVFSMCEWGTSHPWQWAQGIAHLWRSTGDIQTAGTAARAGAEWASCTSSTSRPTSIPTPVPATEHPDMLEVGNGGSPPPNRAPLQLLGAVRGAPHGGQRPARDVEETLAILTNREVIAVDQDPLGMQGRKVRDNGPQEVWMKPLADGARAVILFNRGTEPSDIAVSWDEIGLPAAGKAVVRDLWRGAEVGAPPRATRPRSRPTDVVMVRITPQL